MRTEPKRMVFVYVLLSVGLVCPASAMGLRRAAQVNQTGKVINVTKHSQEVAAANGTQVAAEAALEAEHAEESLDTDFWRTGEPPHFVGQKSLPPKCPQDVPADAPYWSETHRPHQKVCDSAGGCRASISNRERFNSIRQSLIETKKLLDGQGIQYVLYGGSAIGQYRCKDVLPWDNDCDVLVKKQDIPRLAGLAGPLGNGFELKYKSSVIPYVILDTSTGYFCDVFQMDFEPARGTVAVAWPWATDGPCPQYPEWSHQPGVTMKCERYPMHSVTPYQPCMLNGVQMSCANDQATYLAAKYGPSWNRPNVSTRWN